MIDEEQVYKEFQEALEEALAIYKANEYISYEQISVFIEDKVWESTLKYTRMINVTREKFFENLYNETPIDEYVKGITELWNIDHSYMDKSIEELEKMVIQNDLYNAEKYGNKKITERSIKLQNSWREYVVEDKDLYPLNPERDFRILEERYVNRHIKLYENMTKRYKNVADRGEVLSKLLPSYEKLDKTIPYFSHTTGDIVRYVDIGTYENMLYNVNLTRSAWNRAIYDARLLGNHLWYLPAHPYACPLCMVWQGRVFTDDKSDKRYPQKSDAIKGGVGHPNCKHTWTSYWGKEQIQDDKFNSSKWEEKYENKQKRQSLELQKSRLLTNRRIYEELGQQDLVDKTTGQIKKIREKIKEIEK